MRIRTHPGEVLREEFLKPYELSARELAEYLDVPANRLTDIMAERRSITADTAVRLSRFFGNHARVRRSAHILSPTVISNPKLTLDFDCHHACFSPTASIAAPRAIAQFEILFDRTNPVPVVDIPGGSISLPHLAPQLITELT